MTQAGNEQMNQHANLLAIVYLYASRVTHWACFLLVFGVTLVTRSVNLLGKMNVQYPKGFTLISSQ